MPSDKKLEKLFKNLKQDFPELKHKKPAELLSRTGQYERRPYQSHKLFRTLRGQAVTI